MFQWTDIYPYTEKGENGVDSKERPLVQTNMYDIFVYIEFYLSFKRKYFRIVITVHIYLFYAIISGTLISVNMFCVQLCKRLRSVTIFVYRYEF